MWRNRVLVNTAMSPRCGWHVVASLALCMMVQSARATDFGRQSYLLNCAGCHLPDGRGSAPNDVPSLHGAPGHMAGIPEGRAFLTQVPGIAYSSLNDAEVSEVLNWMLLNFNKDTLPASFQPFTEQEVKALRAQRPAEIFKVRRAAIEALRAKGVTLNY